MNVGSLFTGIGGFDLGLERAGMRVIWQCEQDEFCRRVLARHWHDVPCYPDVCEISAGTVDRVDVLCGGFPCQPVSSAGHRLAQRDARWLWPEFARLIGDLRPQYVLVENVSGLLARGLGDVLGDLASVGFDAEWDCVPAGAFGAPHARDRVWLVAYPHSVVGEARVRCLAERPWPIPAADSGDRPAVWMDAPPGPRGVADGIPDRVDRTRALGNALVPQIAEWIGRQVMEHERLVSVVREAA